MKWQLQCSPKGALMCLVVSQNFKWLGIIKNPTKSILINHTVPVEVTGQFECASSGFSDGRTTVHVLTHNCFLQTHTCSLKTDF